MNATQRGVVLLISGPSGSGKSSICRGILEDERVVFSVSATTRSPREGEVDGVHYHFLSKEEFERRIRGGEFIEWAEVHGKRYGTTRDSIEGAAVAGRAVLLDIDVQGARQLRGSYPRAVTIFLLPPSPAALEQRLAARGTEVSSDLELRLRTACSEIAEAGAYDHVIVNDDLAAAAGELRSLVVGHGDRRPRHDKELIRSLVEAFGVGR